MEKKFSIHLELQFDVEGDDPEEARKNASPVINKILEDKQFTFHNAKVIHKPTGFFA